jgi:hypothetical protein
MIQAGNEVEIKRSQIKWVKQGLLCLLVRRRGLFADSGHRLMKREKK